jgi:hypothetical protein
VAIGRKGRRIRDSSDETEQFVMDNTYYSSRGERETVAARRNNTLADVWRSYRRTLLSEPEVHQRSL